jgi:hypothetical protein
VKLPIRNYLAKPLTLFVEPYCHQYEIPPGGEAIIHLEDGQPHSIDYHPDEWVSVWDESITRRLPRSRYSQSDSSFNQPALIAQRHADECLSTPFDT